MDSTLDFLKRLNEHGVEFVVVGGVAAILQGSTHITQDLDVCAPLDEANLTRIINALRDLHPRFRMHPSKPALWEDAKRMAGFRNLNLDTDWGVLDILGEITGLGDYAAVATHCTEVTLKGLKVRVLDLPALIESKRAVHRPKDLMMLPELLFILEQSKQKNKPR